MPIYTVIVEGPNGDKKTVTVNTDNMAAEVVPAVKEVPSKNVPVEEGASIQGGKSRRLSKKKRRTRKLRQ